MPGNTGLRQPVGMLIACLLALAGTSAADGNIPGPTVADRTDPCADAPALELDRPIHSTLGAHEVRCYLLELTKGDFVRVIIDGIGTSAPAQLWLPIRPGEPGLGRGFAYSLGEPKGSAQVLTAAAAATGAYRLTIGPLMDGGPPLPYRIAVSELLGEDRYHQRLEQARTDPRVAWLRRNVVPIRSLSPEDEDYSDLEPLREIFTDVDVVMLGEATHADAPTFHAKTRLVKFLHEQLGFDALAFEADLYQTWKIWQTIRSGGSPQGMHGMYGMYNVREFEPLVAYVGARATSERPLELAGVDPHVGWSAARFMNDLEHFLRELEVDVQTEPAYRQVRRMLMAAHDALEDGLLPADHVFDEPERAAFGEAVAGLEAVIRSRRPDDLTASFWIRVLNNAPNWLDRLAAFAKIHNMIPAVRENGYLSRGLTNPEWNWCKFQNKDGQMAANLLWLAEEYFADRRMIVWAHTGHLYRNPHTITPLLDEVQGRCLFQYSRLDDFTVMGHDVSAALGDRAYALGVISYEGAEQAGPINQDQVEELELEELLYLAGHEYAFLDLRSLGADGAWLHDRLYARTAPHRALRARWPTVLDGFLFIRETTPTQRRQ